MIDFNDTTQPAEHNRESERDEIRADLLARLESVLTTMFPAGKKRRGKFLIGDILGSPGDSLEVVLEGEKVGLWTDRATGDGGDIFALIAAYLGANLTKIPDGGWFPLVAGMGVFILMTTWKSGRELLSQRLKGERLELALFIDSLSSSMPTRVPGTSVFLNADPKGVPHALLHNLMHNKVLHERVVLVSVQFYDVPFVPDIDRVEVRQLKENFWSVIVQYGFKDEPNIPQALQLCSESGLEFNSMETSYFIGRETLIPQLNSEMAFWREKIFVAMFRNAGSATAFFQIPSNRVVELGTQVVL